MRNYNLGKLEQGHGASAFKLAFDIQGRKFTHEPCYNPYKQGRITRQGCPYLEKATLFSPSHTHHFPDIDYQYPLRFNRRVKGRLCLQIRSQVSPIHLGSII